MDISKYLYPWSQEFWELLEFTSHLNNEIPLYISANHHGVKCRAILFTGDSAKDTAREEACWDGEACLAKGSRIPWKTPSEPLRSLVHSCITNLAILGCHLTSLRLIQVPRKLVNLHQNMPWNDPVRMCHWHIDSTICATPVSIWFIFTNVHSSTDIFTQQMIKIHTNHTFLPSGTKISNGVWLISIFLMPRKPRNVQVIYIYINPIHPLNPVKNDHFLPVKSPWADLHFHLASGAGAPWQCPWPRGPPRATSRALASAGAVQPQRAAEAAAAGWWRWWMDDFLRWP